MLIYVYLNGPYIPDRVAGVLVWCFRVEELILVAVLSFFFTSVSDSIAVLVLAFLELQVGARFGCGEMV